MTVVQFCCVRFLIPLFKGVPEHPTYLFSSVRLFISDEREDEYSVTTFCFYTEETFIIIATLIGSERNTGSCKYTAISITSVPFGRDMIFLPCKIL